jgi:hypothetical protein
MDILIWAGTVAALAGVAMLAWCVARAMRLRKSGLPDDALRAGLQKVVLVNMAALGVSALGLSMVVAGILLG